MIKVIKNKLISVKEFVIRKIFNKNIDMQIPAENDVYFCFCGEFGYEIISWIPYLIFLKNKTGIKINTVGRPGSKIFYYFSDNHIELSANEITGMWGEEKSYRAISNRLGIKNMVNPENNYAKKIKINGYEWTTKDIHTEIKETNYEKLDFSEINEPLPFNFKKFVVVNNKYAKEWCGEPVNFFSRDNLLDLRNFLLETGYSIVYNHFVEKTQVDENYNLNDTDIFTSPNCYDLRNFYLVEKNQDKRNRIQVSTYNKASFVIGIQGGNIYLPTVCRKKILMLMRKGDYIDYKELARLYKTAIDVFYEPDHLLIWLKDKLK